MAATRADALDDGRLLSFSGGSQFVSDTDPSIPSNLGNYIVLLSHDLQDGNRVLYRKPTESAALANLTDGTVYTVKRIDANRFQLLANGSVVNLQAASAPNDRYTLEVIGNVDIGAASAGTSDFSLTRKTIPSFNPQTVVGSTIDLGADYGLATGDVVYYSNGGGTDIGGLTSGKSYFVIVDQATPSRIRLAETRNDANAGREITFTSPGTGTEHRIAVNPSEIVSVAKKGVQSNGASTGPSGFQASNVSGAAATLTEPSGTVAHIRGGTTINAANVDVIARDRLDMKAKAGGVGIGLGVGLGAGIVVTTVNADVAAYIDPGAVIRGNRSGEFNLDASLSTKYEILGLAGGGSVFLAIGAGVGVLTDTSGVYALLGAVPPSSGTPSAANTSVFGFTTVNVAANSTHDVNIAIGAGALAVFGVASVAAGVGVVSVTLDGQTMSGVGATTTIGSGRSDADAVDRIVVTSEGSVDVDPLKDGDPMSIALGIAVTPLTAISFAGSFLFIEDKRATTTNIAGGAQLLATGDATTNGVTLSATSSSTIDAASLGIAIALSGGFSLGIGVAIGDAKSTGSTSVQVGNRSRITTRQGAVSAVSNGTAVINVAATPGSVAGFVAGAGGRATATITRTTETTIGAGTAIDAASDIQIDAVALNRGIAKNSTFAVAIGVGVGTASAQAYVTGTTRAALNSTSTDASSVTSGGGLRISTNATNYGNAESQAVSGGILAGRGSKADAWVLPINEAIVGESADISLAGDLIVLAVENAEADANAKGYGGGGISVGVSQADATLKARTGGLENVRAVLGSSTKVAAGKISVNATLGKANAYDDRIVTDDVNVATDTFTVPNHGISTGFVVLYDPAGNTPLTMGNGTAAKSLSPAGGTRQYATIKVDDNSFQLGHETQPFLIDTDNDTIRFTTEHTFADGDYIQYSVVGGTAINGIQSGSTYLVKVIDGRTIKLLDPARAGQVASFTPASSALTGGTTFSETVLGRTFANNQAVTYYAASAPKQVSGVDLANTAPGQTPSLSLGANNILIRDHGFQSGDKVIYRSPQSVTVDFSQIDASGTFYAKDHGLSQGTAVVTISGTLNWSNAGVSTALASGNYTIAVVDQDRFGLVRVPATVTGPAGQEVYTPAVLYKLLPGSGSASVRGVLDTPIRIDAVAGGQISSIDATNNTITFSAAHGLVTGDLVQYNYTPGGSNPAQIGGGLTNGLQRWAVVIDDTTIQLAASLDAAWALLASASAAGVVDLTSATIPSGTHRIDTVTGVTRTLQDGRAYVVAKLDNDTLQLRAAARNIANGTSAIIPFSVTDTANNINVTGKHTLEQQAGSAIGGLVSGKTYYVKKANAADTTFQLSLAAGGAALTNLDTTGRTSGAHQLSGEGVDLGSQGAGTHQFRIDLRSAPASGQTHRIFAANGSPINYSVPVQSDGKTDADASGSSGGLIDVALQYANASVSTSVKASSLADLTARGDVIIGSTTIGLEKSYATNRSGGVIAVGQGVSKTTASYTTTTEVGGRVTTLGSFSATSNSDLQGTSSADVRGGAGIPIYLGYARTGVTNTTSSNILGGAVIDAVGNANVTALSRATNILSDADVRTGGAGGDAFANRNQYNDRSLPSLGDTAGTYVTNNTNVAVSGSISGGLVALTARGQELQAEARARAEIYAALVDAKSAAPLNVTSDSNITINSGSVVRGLGGVDVFATHGTVDTLSKATTIAGGIPNIFVLFLGRLPVAEADTPGTTDIGNRITANAVSDIYANAGPGRDGFALRAISDNESVAAREDADARGLFTSEPSDNDETTDESILWNANVHIGAGLNPSLKVDSTGKIVTAQNINVYDNTGKQYVSNGVISDTTLDTGTTEIIVDDIAPSGLGKILFDGGNSITSPGATLGTFYFAVSLGAVDISNASDRNLVIRNIDTFLPGTSLSNPEVYINSDTRSLRFNIESVAAATDVTIRNLSASVLEIEGTINNPIGATTLFNSRGDIVSRTDRGELKATRTNVGTAATKVLQREAKVVTNMLDVEATLGSIGATSAAPNGIFTERLNIDLVEFAGGDARLDVVGGESLYLDVMGIQRVATPPAPDFTIAVSQISAGEDVDLLLQSGVRQSPQTISGIGVNVKLRSGADPANYTSAFSLDSPPTYYTFYKPDRIASRQTIAANALQGGPSTDVAMTYLFAAQDVSGAIISPREAGLKAGRDISMVQAGDLVGKTANQTIAIDGEFDLVDASPLSAFGGLTIDVTGHVTVTEHTGDMRVAFVRSTSSDVTLSARDASIIENDTPLASADLAADVVGRNLTLTALLGGIGAGVDAFLEIDGAVTGVAADRTNAIARDSIWLYETSGDAQVGQIVSNTADVALGAASSIVDVDNDGAADVVGVNIDLFAVNGSIGTGGNALEIDSAFATTGAAEPDGRLDAYARNSLFVTETVTHAKNELNVFYIEARDGEAVLTLPETAGAADDTEDFRLIGAGKTGFNTQTRFGETSLLSASAVPVSRTPVAGRIAAGTTIDVYVADDVTTEAAAEVLSGRGARFFGDFNGPSPDADVGLGTRMLISGSFRSGISGNPITDEVQFFGANDADRIEFIGTSFASNAEAFGSTTAARADAAAGGTADGRDEFFVREIAATKKGAARFALRLDGQGEQDRYIVETAGSEAPQSGSVVGDYTVNVLDSGRHDDGPDTLDILGKSGADIFLLRAMNGIAHETALDPGSVSLIYGTLSEATSVVPASRPQELARVNYDAGLEGRLTVYGLDGNDTFAVDDTRAIVTLDGGKGEDRFQIGQIYGSPRDAAANLSADDRFATTAVVVGGSSAYLSSGPTLPLVALGGDGNDSFQVYSNKAAVRLDGDDGDDEFVIRAFRLTPTTVSTSQQTQVNGGGGNDLVEYNINAPVSVDGGAGFDKVVVVGTDAADAFVVTADGIYGAGLNVKLAGNEEVREIDGVEGDDDFFILSTPVNAVTRVIGGLGSDAFNVGGDVTEQIYTRELDGLSGVINHGVISGDGVTTGDTAYDGLIGGGLDLNVASPEEGIVLIKESDGLTTVDEEGQTIDSYEISLAKQPTGTVYVAISARRASQSERDAVGTDGNGNPLPLLGDTILISTDPAAFADTVTRKGVSGPEQRRDLVLVFDQSNWNRSQTVYVKAADVSAQLGVADRLPEGTRTVTISHAVLATDPADIRDKFNRAAVRDVEVRVRDNDKAEALIIERGAIGREDGQTVVLEGTIADRVADSFEVRLAARPAAGETVTVTFAFDPVQLGLSQTSLTFTDANWNTPQTVTVTANDDLVVEDLIASLITVTTQGTGAGALYATATTQTVDVLVHDNDAAGLFVVESDGSTVVTKGGTGIGATDNYTVRLTKQPTADVSVTVLGDGQTRVVSARDANNVDRLMTIETGTPGAGLLTGVSVTFAANAALPDTLTLVAGTWSGAGFREGDLVRVTGGSNAKDYKISRLDGAVLTLTDNVGVSFNVTETVTVTRLATAIVFSPANYAMPVTVTIEADPFFTKRAELRFVKEFPVTPHLLTNIRGPLEIVGGVRGDRALQAAIIFPTEINTALPTVPSSGSFDLDAIDVLNIFDDSSQQDKAGSFGAVTFGGRLTSTNLSGLGMSQGLSFAASGNNRFNEPTTFAGGITYGVETVDPATGVRSPMSEIEVFNLMLGSGDDQVTVESTLLTNATHGGLTTLHGGGNTLKAGVVGGDHFIVTGGGGSFSPLVIYGDTSQDGLWCSGDPTRPSARSFGKRGSTDFRYPLAKPFDRSGNDLIDASALDAGDVMTPLSTGASPYAATDVGLVIYGGAGDDRLLGSNLGDHIAGGSGNDTITGNAGDDHVYGDSGFNVDVVTRGFTVANTNAATSPNRDPLLLSADTISGGAGNDYILGDFGLVTQTVPDTEKLLTAMRDTVVSIETARIEASGGRDGADTIAGDGDDDVILGGIGEGTRGDTIFGDTAAAVPGGADVIVGDFGRVVLGPLAGGPFGDHRNGRVETTLTTFGDDDAIYGGGGADWILGAGAADRIEGNEGDDIVFGDHGRIVGNDGSPEQRSAVSTDPLLGGDDLIFGNEGKDFIIAGTGRDSAHGSAGDDLIFGDHAYLLMLADFRQLHAQTVFDAYGDNDTLTGDDEQDVAFGGAGDDNISGGADSDRLLGDVGSADWSGRFDTQANRLLFISTSWSTVVGNDVIHGDDSCDYVIGAQGNDYVYGDGGDDIVAGDSAYAIFVDGRGRQNAQFQSIVPWAGGYDHVFGGPGHDVLVGGANGDTLYGNNAEDLLFGDNIAFQVNSPVACNLQRAITRIEWWGPPPTEIVTGDTLGGATGFNEYGGEGPYAPEDFVSASSLQVSQRGKPEPIIVNTWHYLDPIDGATGDYFDRFPNGTPTGMGQPFNRGTIYPSLDGKFRGASVDGLLPDEVPSHYIARSTPVVAPGHDGLFGGSEENAAESVDDATSTQGTTVLDVTTEVETRTGLAATLLAAFGLKRSARRTNRYRFDSGSGRISQV